MEARRNGTHTEHTHNMGTIFLSLIHGPFAFVSRLFFPAPPPPFPLISPSHIRRSYSPSLLPHSTDLNPDDGRIFRSSTTLPPQTPLVALSSFIRPPPLGDIKGREISVSIPGGLSPTAPAPS
eukprot:Hpha_TRINITY_DN16362_c1_g4::TRINITY_DN16362_c1_g4_i2::g.59528::m.59528